jgi:hypothetical protein
MGGVVCLFLIPLVYLNLFDAFIALK